jgi:hypothetical protein
MCIEKQLVYWHTVHWEITGLVWCCILRYSGFSEVLYMEKRFGVELYTEIQLVW